MRWNNLGIAYLDQLQYADAMQAFGEVVKLQSGLCRWSHQHRSDYIGWEKYALARPALRKRWN